MQTQGRPAAFWPSMQRANSRPFAYFVEQRADDAASFSGFGRQHQSSERAGGRDKGQRSESTARVNRSDRAARSAAE
jgi:hypothetical protein